MFQVPPFRYDDGLHEVENFLCECYMTVLNMILDMFVQEVRLGRRSHYL